MDSTLQAVLVALVAIGVAAWIVVVAATGLLGARVRGRGDAAANVDYASRMARWSRRVAVPGALLAIVAGGWYLVDREVAVSENWWVGTGIGAWLVAFFGSTLFRAPQLARAARLSTERGVDDEDVQWRIRQADLASRGELVLLVVAAVVLVIRPS